MATWEKEKIIFEIVTNSSGSPDVTVHTVKMQPYGSTYPTNAVACSQKSTVKSMWGPDVDLDDDFNYVIYINGVAYASYPSRRANPMLMY